jgi:glycosyltransferase involved in cell wall biosynthesis
VEIWAEPLVSIVINNHNYDRFLRDAIDSALDQSHPATEVVVVDDGSTDGSRSTIVSYGNRLVPVLKQNGGQGSAFNAGFAASRGEIVCLLDSDDRFLPAKVAEVVRTWRRFPTAGWCFHALTRLDGAGSTLAPFHAGVTRAIDFREELRRARMPTFAPPTSGLCFTRDLLRQLLPMPELVGTSADRYLKLAAVASSTGIYLDRELAIQRIHGSNAYSFRPDRLEVGAKSLVFASSWLRSRFPDLRRFSNKQFSMGLGLYWRNGGVEAQYRGAVETYLASLGRRERCEVLLRAFYHSRPWLSEAGSRVAWGGGPRRTTMGDGTDTSPVESEARGRARGRDHAVGKP